MKMERMIIDIRDVDDSQNPIIVTFIDADGDWQEVTLKLSRADWKQYNFYFQSDGERAEWLQENFSELLEVR